MADRVAQYTCPHCSARVYPYSTYERENETTAEGVTRDVLLSSRNQWLRAKGLPVMAWCFSCGHFVEAEGLLRPQVAALYLERSGISSRLTPAARKSRLRELRAQMRQRSPAFA